MQVTSDGRTSAWVKNDENHPLWDESEAQDLIGTTVLVGITRVLADGLKQEQMFGVVLSADAKDGIKVALGGTRKGETCNLPPDLRNFFPAKPGEYRLRSTGEVVVDPDYTSTWTLGPPAR